MNPLATPTDSTPAAVTCKGYSSKELKMIKSIWDDTKQVAQSKMQLCIDLWELKQELDSNDPNVTDGGGGKGQTRFWRAFEQGDLPEYVVGNRGSVKDWLQAAEFTQSGSLAVTTSHPAVCWLSPSLAKPSGPGRDSAVSALTLINVISSSANRLSSAFAIGPMRPPAAPTALMHS